MHLYCFGVGQVACSCRLSHSIKSNNKYCIKANVEEVFDIVEKLKKFSTEGYPYLLKKAHKDVVISNRNVAELINIVNVNAKSGREMLRWLLEDV